MIEKLFSKPFQKALGLYVVFVVGNVTTGIINDAIDNALPDLDTASASILSAFRFMINFEGALIITIGGFLIWYLSQANSK